MLSSCLVTLYYYSVISEFLYYFSNWAYLFTFYSVLNSFRSCRQPLNFGPDALKNKNPVQLRRILRHHAIHHMLYTVSLMSNVVVVPIYWGFLHEDEIRKAREIPVIGEGRAVHLTMLHSFPIIASVINVFCTNCILKFNLWKVIFAMGVIFCSV